MRDKCPDLLSELIESAARDLEANRKCLVDHQEIWEGSKGLGVNADKTGLVTFSLQAFK